MNFTDMKLQGTNVISVTDSLNSLLLGLKVRCNADTIIPDSNELIIYVDKSEEVSNSRRQFVLNLGSSLKYLDGNTDELILEPKLVDNTVKMVVYVKRVIENNILLEEASIVDLDYQEIILFEGVNYIYTNYTDAVLEIIYPKNSDLMKYFLNNTLFAAHDVLGQDEFSLDDIYFKDAFTNTDNGINASFNNIDVACITSRNDKFNLDSNGNLFVNSITTVMDSTATIDFNSVYPVGSIYMNVTDINPTTLFGGTWERIQDTFLLASGTTYANGTTGGEATHTLTVNEMPSHTHNTQGQWMTSGSENRCLSYNKISSDPVRTNTPILATGGGKAHNNMPPYLAIYVWKRTA